MTTLMGKLIKDKRKEKGLSQEKLAEMVYVTTNHIGLIERGKTHGSGLTIELISEVLEIKDWQDYWEGNHCC